ncbi:MAG: copper-binding protein [Rhodospirillaceae bacterium]|nr:copper-binding protein [Rhodospirillaceae bacterium]
MKAPVVLALVAGLFASAPAVLAHEGHSDAHGKGVVNAVDAATHKVNLSHEAISALGWPAMKMDFAVAPSVDLKALQPGTAVEFTIEKNKAGTFEIQSIKPVSTK